MDMIFSHAEQHKRHLERQKRLWTPADKKDATAYKEKIAELEEELLSIRSVRVQRMEDVVMRERQSSYKLEQLELDVADLQARLIQQANIISKLTGQVSKAGMRPVEDIIEEVLKDYPGVTVEDIKGVRRTRRLIEPRHACMYAVYKERRDLSFPVMGRIFGGRDHTTVLSAVEKMKRRENNGG